MLRARLVVTLFVLVVAPARLRSQGQPLGPEFRVNTYTPGGQLGSLIALDGSGNFVIVWEDANGHDGDGPGAFGQRYASDGVPLGGEFRVNTYTTNFQLAPFVSSDYAGNFVVAWTSYGQNGQNAGFDVFAQRFDPRGAPVGSEFRVNTHITADQTLTSVASDPAGNVVMAWSSRGQDGSGYGVFAQRYASTGEPMGGEFQVNSYTRHDQTAASVAMDALGNFVIAWQGPRGAHDDIFARRYDSSGAPLGSDFRVNTYTSNDQRGPAIAADTAGDFIIVWKSYGQDGSYSAVYGRRYASSGTPLGAEFRVNTATAFDQTVPSVASDPDGNFVVVWQGSNPIYLDVFAQRFSNSGVPLGGASRVNTYTSKNQIYPAVATDPAGNFVVTWTSAGSPGQDGSGPGIFAQRYNMIVP